MMEVQLADKIKPVEKVDDLSPVQKLARLDQERAEILASAKADALQKANEAVGELNALGFHYLLCEEGDTPKTSKKGEPSDAACPICLYKTTPVHDRRSHKKQAIKAPFTDEELKQKGLVKVQ
jgi:hypothetical protein